MTQGTRYPTLGFTTGGTGEAADGIPPQPFETFCYDSALLAAKIHNFNIIPYTSVLPKELFGHIGTATQLESQFHHGAVLEVIMAGTGAQLSEHRAIATGLGICWGQNDKGELIGGWVAEYVEFFQTAINDGIAEAHARMWLTKSLTHELTLRGVKQHSEFTFWHNYLNLTQPYGYCLTAMGFLNFDYAPPAKM